MCFECSLLDLVVRRVIVDTEAVLYYQQLTSLPGVSVTPLSLGALLNAGHLRLSAGCQLARQARRAGVSAKCKKCKEVAGGDGGALLACCFCASHFHNTESCLGLAVMTGPKAVLVSAPTFTWACPQC